MFAEVLCTGLLAGAAVWLVLGLGKAPGDDGGAAGSARGELACFAGLLNEAVAHVRARLPVQERPKVTAQEVSDMVDVVRLGLTAGLTFDAALELYCGHRAGALSEHMRRALFSWRAGVLTRRQALSEAAHAVKVPALEVFGATVCQALEFGAPVSEALAAQSREIREAHRAEVERAIERAPVKILIPTGTLILPALLLAILGPLLSASGML